MTTTTIVPVDDTRSLIIAEANGAVVRWIGDRTKVQALTAQPFLNDHWQGVRLVDALGDVVTLQVHAR